MGKESNVKIIYSTLFSLIGSVKLKGWCIHLVCLRGEGFFTLADRPFHIRKNDAVVVNVPQQVRIIGQSEDLQVEVLAAPLDFLNSQLPANNYGIGGGISLYDDPVIHLSEEEAEKFAAEVEELYPDVDVDFHFGGQPIYYYVMAVE